MPYIQLTEMSQNDSARKEPINLFYGFFFMLLKPRNIDKATVAARNVWSNFDYSGSLHKFHMFCSIPVTIVTWEGSVVLSVDLCSSVDTQTRHDILWIKHGRPMRRVQMFSLQNTVSYVRKENK